MHTESLDFWQHEHVFGQDRIRTGERRTLTVLVLTAVFMVVEIAGGIVFGSMALLADGLHMGSHALALGITAFAYLYARRHASDRSYTFGTGKVNALAGFSSAILLVVFACFMGWESIHRLVNPVVILFDWAIAVAVSGLMVNAVSVLILKEWQADHDHGHGHSDHNLRAAYLHVLADALTSFLAIFALLAGKYFRLIWMDPVMGIVGAILVSRWSWGLLKETTAVLLDKQAPDSLALAIREAIEGEGDDRVADLHLWSIGPGIYAAAVTIVSNHPQSPEHYKSLLPDHIGIAHAVIEVFLCEGPR